MSMIFAFASCEKDDTNIDKETSTTTSTTQQETTKNVESTTSVATESLVGVWIYDETVSPQNFYTDFYNSEITKTNVKLRTTYKFNNDGTFSTAVSIVNISTVRVEYRSLMVEAGRKNVESQGKYLTTDDVLYYENYADEILEDICKEQKGTYVIDGNKITYTTNDDSFRETFAVKGDKLTVTGESDNYSITLTRNTAK